MEYLNPKSLASLAAQGRAFMKQHERAVDRIENMTGVDRNIIVAIWGRETAYGTYKLPHDAIRVLATQAYTGRRKDMFRNELLHALKMLQDGMPRAKMRSSWAGAVGLTQFMPSEYYNHADDGDGDGKVDLFDSVDDALASAARQLANKGWVKGLRWGYEVQGAGERRLLARGPARRAAAGRLGQARLRSAPARRPSAPTSWRIAPI